jgi:cholesterol transport system auxiliary component
LSLKRAVVNPGETSVPLALRVELQEFSQLFDTAQNSSGLVRMRATLIEVKDGADRLVAQQVFIVQRPAASPDAPGGVRALLAATDAAVEEIGAWLQQQPAR